MPNLLRRLYNRHVFYRVPRVWRFVGYINVQDRMVVGPFGVRYQTYSHHRFDTPVLGGERFAGLRVFDKY